MSNPPAKPEHLQDGDDAVLEVMPSSFGMAGPGSDWWVNEPIWDQAVRRLTAPPLPPPAATPAQQPQSQPPRDGVTAVVARQVAAHEDNVKRS